ncbi:MAG TPA: carbon monoxide dehydrogenase subunit G [Ktedonobacterales bacterium]|nr:carbon monoxide dehydrogenase subunit G [Ktedonobacterales bacterium]
MNLSGSYTFNADQQTVWALMTNPDAIAKALPGVDKLDPIEGESNAWRATAKIGISIVSGTFTGTVRMTDLQPPTSYRLNVAGEGQQSVISGFANINLAPAADTAKTTLTWTAEATISGKLAGIGQRLLTPAANMMANQFFQGLAKQLPSA